MHEELKNRIAKIQNKSNSLHWGFHSDEEVGTVIYASHDQSRKSLFFLLNENGLFRLESNKQVKLLSNISTNDEVIAEIISNLKAFYTTT